MTQFGQYVQKKYQGDYYKASMDLLYNESRPVIKRYISGMTDDEVRKFMKAYIDIMNDRYPGGASMITDEDFFCRILKVEQSQLKDMPNPYTAHLKRVFFISLLVVIASALIGVILFKLGITDASVACWGIAILGTGVSSTAAGSIVLGVRFRIMQKKYHSKAWQEKQKTYLPDKERIDLIRDLLFVNNVKLDVEAGLRPASDLEKYR